MIETPRRVSGSLLERAADVYDFGAHLRARGTEPLPGAGSAQMPEPSIPSPSAPAGRRDAVAIDRAMLADKGLIVPGAAIGSLAEEFRLIKRQLLQTARGMRATSATGARTLLVCSARPGDGKTYCAINLAISLAAERDTDVLLVDADFAKPDVMTRFDLPEARGLLDALGDPAIDVNDLIVPTDIAQLSLLPAGTRTISDTELLASGRTVAVIDALLAAHPNRLLIFDSPPALSASPASVLAGHVGQVMLVVRADRTGETDLREAVTLLDGCEHIQLVLNAVSYSRGGPRFGSYYGQEDAA